VVKQERTTVDYTSNGCRGIELEERGVARSGGPVEKKVGGAEGDSFRKKVLGAYKAKKDPCVRKIEASLAKRNLNGNQKRAWEGRGNLVIVERAAQDREKRDW